MADNFGFGNFKAPAGIQETKINPGKLPAGLIPNRRLQAKQASSKDRLIAAGLGSLMPFVADAVVSNLPGLDSLLYKQNIPAGAGASKYESPRQVGKVGIARGSDNPLALPEETGNVLEDQQGPPVPGKTRALGTLNPIEEEFKKRQALINRSLPSRDLKQKSVLGKGLTTALSFLPGALLDEDETGQTAAAYINSANTGLKSLGQQDAINLDNYLKTETKRGEKLLEAADLTAATYFTSIPNIETGLFENISRKVQVAKDGSKYIMSQGRAGFDDVLDSEGNSHTVPKGSFYIKESEFLSKDAPVKDESVGMVVNANNPEEIAMGYKRSYIDKNGKQQMQFLIADPLNGGELTPVSELNKSVADGGRGTNWLIPPSNYFEPQKMRGQPLTERGKELNKRDLALGSVTQVANIGQQLHTILKTSETNPALLTTAGGLGGSLVLIEENLKALGKQLLDSTGVGLDATLRDRFEVSNQNLTDGQNNKGHELYRSNENLIRLLSDKTSTDQDRQDAAIRYKDALTAYVASAEAQGASATKLKSIGSFNLIDPSGNFVKTETDRALIEALSLKLAYFSAGQDGSTGTALSDTDLLNYMTQIGYNAKLGAGKIASLETFVANQFSKFDDGGVSTQLVNASVNNDPEDIAFMDRHLRGTGTVAQNTLEKLRDFDRSEEERQKIANEILISLSKKLGTSAEAAYVYDPKTGRIVWNDVGRYFRKSRAGLHKYWKDVFDKRGSTFLPTPRSTQGTVQKGITKEAAGYDAQGNPRNSVLKIDPITGLPVGLVVEKEISVQ